MPVDLDWGLHHINWLTAVAGEDPGECGVYRKKERVLHCYEGNNCPGQPWGCYRWAGFKETLQDKRLGDRFRDLLTPSTTQEKLEELQANSESRYCAYLRTNEKRMDIEEWLQNDGRTHNGAHFPLCVFTKNASARSAQKEK